jgi:hypothetical protein
MVMIRLRVSDPPPLIDRPVEDEAFKALMKKSRPKRPRRKSRPPRPPVPDNWLLCGRCGEYKDPESFDQDASKPWRENRRAICKLCRKQIRSLKNEQQQTHHLRDD